MLEKKTALKLPTEFWYFASAKLFYTLGLRMTATVVIYQIYKLTSTYMVGLAGLIEFVPAVVAALFAGHYIDNNDKQKVLKYAYVSYLLCALLLAFISSHYIHLAVSTKVSLVFFAVFCSGIIRSFASPAASSMITAIVPKVALQKAISISSSTYLISSISGHASAGILIALVGISYAYTIAAVCLFFAVVSACYLLPKPAFISLKKEPILTSIQQGCKYVYTSKVLLAVLSLDLFAVLFGGAVAFIPEIAETVLHSSPIGYGFLNAAIDIGAFISVIVLLYLPMKKKQGTKLFIAVFGFGVCIIIFGLSKVYWLSFIALVLAGICDGVSVVIRGVITQLYTPDHLRGRVSSINTIFINSSNELGQFESGISAKLLGTLPAVIFGGVMSIAIVVGTWLCFPKLKKITY